MIQLLEQSRTGLRLAATCQANEHHLREGGQDINELEVNSCSVGWIVRTLDYSQPSFLWDFPNLPLHGQAPKQSGWFPSLLGVPKVKQKTRSGRSPSLLQQRNEKIHSHIIPYIYIYITYMESSDPTRIVNSNNYDATIVLK